MIKKCQGVATILKSLNSWRRRGHYGGQIHSDGKYVSHTHSFNTQRDNSEKLSSYPLALGVSYQTMACMSLTCHAEYASDEFAGANQPPWCSN